MPVDDNMEAGNPTFASEDGNTENFEADFDAGVDANEEEDPKKFIQQLTGKLSQSLKKYNDGLSKPDVELDKYVAGMILKQSVAGLDKSDRDDIISKIDDIELPNAEDDQKEDENPQQEAPQQPQSQEEPMQNECSRTLAGAGNISKGGMVKKGYRNSPFVGKR